MAVVKSITCSNGRVTAASGGTLDTADVTDDAVTYAKLQNLASGVLLGRTTGGSGNAEELSVGNGLTLSAGSLSAAVQMSVTVDASGLKLSGDSASPGNSKFYGTNGSGTKGWYASLVASGQTYTASNVTTDRSYDANATTLDEVADVLGTLIADLRTAGVIL